MGVLPINRPRGAIHDLGYFDTLSDQGEGIICLSEKDIYVIVNLLEKDAVFRTRWGREIQAYQYVPASAEEMGPVLDWRDSLILRINSMECLSDLSIAISASLAEIREAISSTSTGGGCGCIPPPTVTGSIIDPGDDFGPSNPPPPGFGAPVVVSSRRCQAANWLYSQTLVVVDELISLGFLGWLQGVGLLMSALVLLLSGGSAGTLWGMVVEFAPALLEIATALISGGISLSDIRAQWIAQEEDLICDIYSAESSFGLYQNLLGWQANSGGQISSAELSFVQLILNPVVISVLWFERPEAEAAIAQAEILYDCSGCSSPPAAEALIWQSSQIVSYASIVCGGKLVGGQQWTNEAPAFNNAIVGWGSPNDSSYPHTYFYIENPIFGHPEWANNGPYWQGQVKLFFTMKDGSVEWYWQGLPSLPTIDDWGPGWRGSQNIFDAGKGEELDSWVVFGVEIDPDDEYLTLWIRHWADTNTSEDNGESRKFSLIMLDPPAGMGEPC